MTKILDKGYLIIRCGEHIIGQIDLKEWPCEVVKRKRKKCFCGETVDSLGCGCSAHSGGKHHDQDTRE